MKRKSGILIGIAATLLVTLLLLLDPLPLQMLESKLLDYRFKRRGPLPLSEKSEKILIAAIDEKSLYELGRWPWDRDVMAGLVEKLYLSGAAVISFDVLFCESERHDDVFAGAMWDAANVILPMFFDPVDFTNLTAEDVIIPVDVLLQEAMALGHINMFSDADGTMRWSPLIIEFHDGRYPSLALQTAAFYLAIPPDAIDLEAEDGIRLGRDMLIPTDSRGKTLINYYGPVGTFRYVSISDILDGSVGPEELSDAIIFIGATAAGLFDLRVTPFSPVMPGVEKHAGMTASILDNNFLKAVPVSVDLLAILLSGAIVTLLAARLKAGGASAGAACCLVAILLSGYWLFAGKNLWLNVTYPSLNVALIFVSTMVYSYAVEERRARKIRSMFSSYVTRRIVDELIKNPDMARLGGERREVTVLFSDIMGFTTFSEKNTPEDVVSLLNEYLGEMTDVVFKWEGTLDKFIGDAIMAFWGAPVPQENHALLAVQCAVDMGEKLQELQKKWQAEGKTVLDCGIGINTGEVVVGNTGAEGKKMDYTIIGDEVNLGARAESLTRQYGERILITEFTAARLKDCIKNRKAGKIKAVEPIERVTVKGKEKPVEIFRIVTDLNRTAAGDSSG